MLSRAILAGALLLSASPLCAQPAAPFEQRLVAILNAGGTVDAMHSRLSRIGSDRSLTHDQRVAVDAVRALVSSKSKPGGLSLAEAEAFAARNPASPASAVLIAEAALANDQPERSADSLIAVAAGAGPIVQLVSPATVSKLTGELDAKSDKMRTVALAKALLQAGWTRGSASLRSYLAIAAIRDELASERVEPARRLLRAVRSPASLHLILIDDRLAPLRNDVVATAGPMLERAWRDYLTSARDEWLQRRDPLSAVAYAEALQQAHQYDALNSAFLVRFMRGYNCPSDLVARSIASDLAQSLTKVDRWTRAEDVMRRSGGISRPVYAAMLLERGEFGRAAALFDRSLKAAAPPEDEGEKGIAWLRAAGSCASFQNGSGAALPAGTLKLLDVSARLFVLLCMDRAADARAALLEALADEDEREDALRWMQPFADPKAQSEFRKDMNRRIRALQREPGVIAAVSRYGRILDWPLTAAAPQPAELATAKTPAPWQCGDQSDWDTASTGPESIRLPDSNP